MIFSVFDSSRSPKAEQKDPLKDQAALEAEKHMLESGLEDATQELAGSRADLAVLQRELADAQAELAAILEPLRPLPFVDQLLTLIQRPSLLSDIQDARELKHDLEEEIREEEDCARRLSEEIRTQSALLQQIIQALRNMPSMG